MKKNKKLFDYVIGNPPYQESNDREDVARGALPVYHLFMEEAYKVGSVVELITPARFLFNAGATPKAWNQKMLKDSHLRVASYFSDSTEIFPSTDIKGGVAITIRDETKDYGAIETFATFPELNSILKKVKSTCFESFGDIVITRTAYRLSDKMHKDHPEAISQLSDGHAYDMSSNIFVRLAQIFFDKKPNDSHDYVRMYGLVKNKRCYKYVRRDYVQGHKNLDYYKVLIPQANGSGAIGEVLSTPLVGQPLVGQPLVGHTETFLSIGCFDTEKEAMACLKYVKTKFARAMLGILKVTQNNPPATWRYVPLQNFHTPPQSDIDWSKSVHEIDLQLYRKYGLNKKEIAFIESHVKEMA